MCIVQLMFCMTLNVARTDEAVIPGPQSFIMQRQTKNLVVIYTYMYIQWICVYTNGNVDVSHVDGLVFPGILAAEVNGVQDVVQECVHCHQKHDGILEEETHTARAHTEDWGFSVFRYNRTPLNGTPL